MYSVRLCRLVTDDNDDDDDQDDTRCHIVRASDDWPMLVHYFQYFRCELYPRCRARASSTDSALVQTQVAISSSKYILQHKINPLGNKFFLLLTLSPWQTCSISIIFLIEWKQYSLIKLFPKITLDGPFELFMNEKVGMILQQLIGLLDLPKFGIVFWRREGGWSKLCETKNQSQLDCDKNSPFTSAPLYDKLWSCVFRCASISWISIGDWLID